MNPIEKALELAFQYGQIDGSHHRLWVIDQMVRALTETEEAYQEFVTEYGADDCYWDTGIAP